MPRSARFQRFVAPAARRPALWRLGLGILLSLVVYALWIAAVFLGAAALGFDPRRLLVEISAPRAPWPVFVLLATFAGMAAGPIAAAALLHRRWPGTLFGPAPRVLRHFAAAAGVVLALYGVGLGLWSLVHDSAPGVAPGRWLALLPLTLVGILVQTGAEEVLFRGYLLQQLAARFRSPLIWAVLPAVAFGLVHYAPGLWGLAGIGSATLFGLAAADLTARTGSLGAAWGFHFANNLVAIAGLATQGTITGLALRLTPYRIDEAGTWTALGDVALLVLAWGLIRHLLRG